MFNYERILVTWKRILNILNLVYLGKLINSLKIIQDASLYFNTLYFNFQYLGLLNYLLRLIFIGQKNFLKFTSQKDIQSLQNWTICYYFITFVINIYRHFKIIATDRVKNEDKNENITFRYLKYTINTLDTFFSWLNLFYLISNIEEYLLVNFNLWRKLYLELFWFENKEPLFHHLSFINWNIAHQLMIPLILLNFILFQKNEIPVIIAIFVFFIKYYPKTLMSN